MEKNILAIQMQFEGQNGGVKRYTNFYEHVEYQLHLARTEQCRKLFCSLLIKV